MVATSYRISKTGDTAGDCRWGVYTWPSARLVQCFASRRAAEAYKREMVENGAPAGNEDVG